MPPSTVLVTGASRFIGGQLVLWMPCCRWCVGGYGGARLDECRSGRSSSRRNFVLGCRAFVLRVGAETGWG